MLKVPEGQIQVVQGFTTGIPILWFTVYIRMETGLLTIIKIVKMSREQQDTVQWFSFWETRGSTYALSLWEQQASLVEDTILISQS